VVDVDAGAGIAFAHSATTAADVADTITANEWLFNTGTLEGERI